MIIAISINMLRDKARVLHPTQGSSFRRRRHGVSEIIGVLLMVAIVVASSFIIVTLVTGLFGTLTAGGTSTLVTTTNQMNIPGTYNTWGILSFTLTNRAATSIETVSFDCLTTAFIPGACSGLVMSYNGQPVSAVNLLPVGSTANGNGFVKATTIFTAGTTYSILITVTFVTGSTQVFVANVPSTS